MVPKMSHYCQKSVENLKFLLNEPTLMLKERIKELIKKLTLSTLYHFLAKFFRPRIVL